MTTSPLDLTRTQVLAFRRRVGSLDERLPPSERALRRAAWAGLQDSVPRAALLSFHARVRETTPTTWEDPSLVQLWGPRYTTYVVAERDRGVFSLGRLPREPGRRREAEDLAERLAAVLGGAEMVCRQAGRALGMHPSALRYAAPTGRFLIRWDGARQPVVRAVPAPDLDPAEARLELVRRYLHVLGPATADGLAAWAGIRPGSAVAALKALRGSLTPVRTPLGEAWGLAADEPELRREAGPSAEARLLPSGDPYTLLQGPDRALLVPDAGRRARLWTPRVWPGAVLVGGEVVGTWRRAGGTVTVDAWEALAPRHRTAVEAEAAALPLPGVDRITVRWTD